MPQNMTFQLELHQSFPKIFWIQHIIQYLDMPKICMENKIWLGMCSGEVFQEGEGYDYIMYQ